MAAKKPAKKMPAKKVAKKANDTVPVYETVMMKGKGKKAQGTMSADAAERYESIIRERISRSAAQELARKQGKTGRVTGIYMPANRTADTMKIRTAPKTVTTKKGTLKGKTKKK